MLRFINIFIFIIVLVCTIRLVQKLKEDKKYKALFVMDIISLCLISIIYWIVFVASIVKLL